MRKANYMTVKNSPSNVPAKPSAWVAPQSHVGGPFATPNGYGEHWAFGPRPIVAPVSYQTIEMPFMATTTFDNVVSDPRERAAQQKRKRIRDAFGLPELERHSLGRIGSFSLDPTAVLLAFVARSRWNDPDVITPYQNMFRTCGLNELVRSDAYTQYITGTVERVRTHCRALSKGDFGPGVVNNIARQELYSNGTARAIANQFSSALSEFAASHPEVDRLSGSVVRVEGSEAVIVLQTPDKDELHKVDVKYLELFGLNQAEATFVLLRQKWTPDTTVGVYVPAITLVDHNGIDEETLRSVETSLPSL